jgi:alkylation response protein AidB-like acyl-CoA dehydrogenase
VYRTAGLDRRAYSSESHEAGTASRLRALEEFAVEASIAKVAGSEIARLRPRRERADPRRQRLRQDYRAERYYRDARVNRIFEGTNEINRLLIPACSCAAPSKTTCA